ncbi:hypothetical protein B0J11DRAFT_538182 [Dendryphion nanum]|uniref:Ribosomal protein/NADH dehydrogenase domain-containing protein n=1 Tax=Dendryphion nanum TaxID=256645 RepID=A0A9P9DD38_9PLEO|nr:hypothetical protein B0J11DRAFT_538182 [Dendryphion nanum]
MVNIISRTRRLRELLWIRVGPGSVILPKEVSKISLEFHEKIEGGHRGARKFWREMLPRLKYRNPALPIEVLRHKDANGPSLLKIYTKVISQTTSSPSTTTSSSDDVSESKPAHSVDIRDMPESEILQHLISRTDAVEIEPTERELEELKEVEEFKLKSEADRVEVREKLLKEREEARLLKLARGEIAA